MVALGRSRIPDRVNCRPPERNELPFIRRSPFDRNKAWRNFMTRRELARRTAISAGAGLVSRGVSQAADTSATPDATGYVASFIVDTRYSDIPAPVLELARKSILDGIGLALSGSIAETGEIVRKYLESTGVTASKGATVIGSSLRAPLRFAAFANGVGIHADDYDDTQLAVAKDRVYGLLTHPTAPVLPATASAACRARTCCSPTTLAWRLKPRSAKPFPRGITKMASIPPARPACSVARQPHPN